MPPFRCSRKRLFRLTKIATGCQSCHRSKPISTGPNLCVSVTMSFILDASLFLVLLLAMQSIADDERLDLVIRDKFNLTVGNADR